MDRTLAELETALKQQTSAHEELLSLIARKRDAVRSANHAEVARCCGLENGCVQKITELEKQRLALVGDLTLAIDPAASSPLPLRELAERLAEPARGRVLVLRQALRERIERVHRENAIAKRAIGSLVSHMQGIMQTIGGAVTGVAVYSREGGLPPAALAVSTFNATA